MKKMTASPIDVTLEILFLCDSFVVPIRAGITQMLTTQSECDHLDKNSFYVPYYKHCFNQVEKIIQFNSQNVS
jgi:hypothetical protein